jgi:hypothetical protein
MQLFKEVEDNAKRCTAIVFDLFEQLHCLLVQWINGHIHGKTLLSDAFISGGDGEGTFLLLNPKISLQASSPTILQLLNRWEMEVATRLAHRLPSDPLAHPSTPLREFLFASSSAPALKPTPAGSTPRSILKPGPARPTGRIPSYLPPPAVDKPKGELAEAQPGPVRTAVKHLFTWKDTSKAGQHPGTILSQILAKTSSKAPRMRVVEKAGDKPVERALCFPFVCEPVINGKCQGCDGTMVNSKTKKKVLCNRVHVDGDDAAWLALDKSAFTELWTFLQSDAVKDIWVPSTFLAEKMA